jgi:hypothetical protein
MSQFLITILPKMGEPRAAAHAATRIAFLLKAEQTWLPLFRALPEGVLPAQAIATLRGMSLEAVVEELEQAGMTPAERPIP